MIPRGDWFHAACDVQRPMPVSILCDLYEQHADTWYRRADGTRSGEQVNILYALRDLREALGDQDASTLSPRSLIDLRDRMIAKGLARTTINKRVNIIRRMVRWGCEMEIVSPETWSRLQALRPLLAHRSAAREPDPVRPVSLDDIEATLAEITSPPVAAMVRVQLLTGMRPGEVTQMRACDIHIENGQWMYHPRQHKLSYRQKVRAIPIGPKAREVIQPWAARRPREAVLFSPQDSGGRNTKAEAYTKDTYRKAIQRACDMAGVERWSPNQLRHTAATIIEGLYGLDAAQAVLGHSKPDTTRIYSDAQAEVAARIMREIG